MRAFVVQWFVTTIAVYITSKIVPGIYIGSLSALVGSTLLLRIINVFIRPILLLLSTPCILCTMGVFILVVNASILSFVAWLLPAFQIKGFWNALLGSMLISLMSWLLSLFFHTRDGSCPRIITHHPTVKRANAHVINNP